MAKKNKSSKKSRCWKGYKPKPGSTPYADGSCIKEANVQLGRAVAKSLGIEEAGPIVKKLLKTGAKVAAKVAGKAALKKVLDVRGAENAQSSIVDEAAAWTKKSGQNPDGGLNAKGRASAKADGHDLKAPVTSDKPKGKAKARKKSFCARMGGMRKRQKASNNTGEDRLSKSLRKWKC